MNVYKYTLPAILCAVIASWLTARIIKETSAQGPVADTRSVDASSATSRSPEPKPDVSAAELRRLSRENDELKTELEAVRAQLAEHAVTLEQAAAELEELRRPMIADILSSTLRAELKSGEVVVTGGYKLPDGRRLYAFAKPVITEVNGGSVTMIHGRYLTITDEVGESVGLDSLITNAANTLQHGEVWVPEEEAAVLDRLQGTPGTEVLAFPSLSVSFDRSETIRIGDIELRVTPSRGDGVDSLSMELRLEQPQPLPAADEVE